MEGCPLDPCPFAFSKILEIVKAQTRILKPLFMALEFHTRRLLLKNERNSEADKGAENLT